MLKNGKFGCAVWGCGWVASGHINAYLKNPYCQVVALGSRRLESIQAKQAEFGVETRAYTDFQQLLDDDEIDIISLCTPNNQHAEETIRALAAGKHVFVDKPIAILEEDIPRLIATTEAAKTHTQVGFVQRFNPRVLLQKKLVQEGELGRVFMVNADYWFGRERKGWMKHQAQTGCAFILGGCHSVDMARFVLGSDIRRVSAQGIMVGDYYEYPPVQTAQVQFDNGAIGVFTCSLVGTNPFTTNLTLLGENGTIVNDKFFLKRFEGQKDYFTLDTGASKSGDVYSHPFPALVNQFVQCIQEDRESPNNIRSAVNAHLACIGIQKSAENGGKAVTIGEQCLMLDA